MIPPRLEIAPGCFTDPESNVVTLSSLELLWDAYAKLVQMQRDDERLLTDMEHQKKVALANAAWRRVYLATEHSG